MVSMQADSVHIFERPISRASTTASMHTHLNLPARSNFRTTVNEALVDRVQVMSDVGALEWGPQAASDYLAFGTHSDVTIIRVKMDDSPADTDTKVNLNLSTVASFPSSSSVYCLAWSPFSGHNSEGELEFNIAYGCEDNRIRLVRNGSDEGPVILGSHLDFVNDLAFGEQENDISLLSTVSDDCSCIVWNADDASILNIFALDSPGVSTKFHVQKPWLMIAQGSGNIMFVDPRSKETLMTLSTGSNSIRYADWCSQDVSRACAAFETQTVLWNIVPGKLGSLPNAHFQTKSKQVGKIKFSPAGDSIVVTLKDYSRVKIGSGKNARHILPVYVYRAQQGNTMPFMSLVAPDSNGMAIVEHISWTNLGRNIRLVAGSSNQHIYFWVVS